VLCGYLVYDYYLIVNFVLLLFRSLTVTVFFYIEVWTPQCRRGSIENATYESGTSADFSPLQHKLSRVKRGGAAQYNC
jgi:hypothetical protein